MSVLVLEAVASPFYRVDITKASAFNDLLLSLIVIEMDFFCYLKDQGAPLFGSISFRKSPLEMDPVLTAAPIFLCVFSFTAIGKGVATL